MAQYFNVDLEDARIAELAKLYEDTLGPRKIGLAMAAALNRAASKAKASSGSAITKRYNIKRQVKDSEKNIIGGVYSALSIYKANQYELTAAVIYKGERNPIEEFSAVPQAGVFNFRNLARNKMTKQQRRLYAKSKARQRANGTLAATIVKGKPVNFKHAFIVYSQRQHKALWFVRDYKGGGKVMGRKIDWGKGKLKSNLQAIRKLSTLTIPQMAHSPTVESAIRGDATEEFLSRFSHELDVRLRGFVK